MRGWKLSSDLALQGIASVLGTMHINNKTLTIKSGMKQSSGQIIMNGGTLILQNLTLQSGTIYLSGSTGTIHGNLIQAGGTIILHGGHLEVTGD